MSKKIVKPDYDDLDDDLDELLRSEEETLVKKTVSTGKGDRSDGVQAKVSGDSESLSKTRDVDPKKLLQNFDVDALDENVFGGPTVNKVSKGASVSQKPMDFDRISADNSKRYEVERPPTRSGGQKGSDASPKFSKSMHTSGSKSASFDDDDADLLAKLGLDSPRNKGKIDSTSIENSGAKLGSAKSAFNDLGRQSQKYTERDSESGVQNSKDEGFVFGSYIPSTSNSRPSSKRSVRFDDVTDSGNRPSSTSKLRSTAPASFLESMVESDDRSWLDIASGISPALTEKSKAEQNRPSSEGQMREKFAHKTGPVAQKPAEPVDWLGFSRIGSPDTTPRDLGKTFPEGQGIKKDLGIIQTTPVDVPKRSNEDLGTEKPLGLSIGKLFKGDNNDGDWLGIKKASQPSISSKDPLDWLLSDDVMEEKTKSKERSLENSNKKPFGDSDTLLGSMEKLNDDYLGLGMEIELKDKKQQGGLLGLRSKSIDEQKMDHFTLDFKSEFPVERTGSKNLKLPDKLDEELFGSPAKLNSSLPLDLDQEKPKQTFPWEAAPDKQKQDKGIFSPENHLFSELSLPAGGKESKSAKGDGNNLTTGKREQLLTPIGTDFQLQEQLLQEQQRQFLQLQQQQQVALQKQFQAQQERMQKQREEQMKAIQQQQQQLMSQPLLSGLSLEGLNSETLQTKLKELESENKFLHNMMETIKHQHQQEKTILEESYQKRLELNEETFTKRLERLKQENELISGEIIEKFKMLEKEKSELFSLHLKKQTEWELEKQREIDHLRDAHRSAIEDLSTEHQMALERIVKAKNFELDAVTNSRDHARTFETAIHKMEENSSGLHDLQTKMEFHHSNSLSEREMAARSRDESLKVLQDRLERQQHDNQMERARLQGLITKLEFQLTNQSRELEEEKWRLHQNENNLKAAQQALEQERLRMMEITQQDRMEIEKIKMKLLDDQKSVMVDLNKEKIQLAEGKAQFNVTSKLKQQEDERMMEKVALSEAELAAGLKAIAEEKSKINLKQRDLELLEDRLKKQQGDLEHQRHLLVVEKERLEQVALCVQEKSLEIENFVVGAANDKQEGQKFFSLAKQTEQEQNQRLNKIQMNLQTLHAKEKQIAEERLSLAKERADLESAKEKMLCSSCRNPIKSVANLPRVSGIGGMEETRLAPSENNFLSRQSQLFQYGPLQNIYAAIQTDRSIRLWKIAADKDKQFLEEERYFLEAIKHTPHH